MQKEYSLSELLDLPDSEQQSLGVAHTLREILQQPRTWRQTCQRLLSLAKPVETFLRSSGPADVYLVGAGTSDYIGKSVCALLQSEWARTVQAIPSTDLLTNMPDHVIPRSEERRVGKEC